MIRTSEQAVPTCFSAFMFIFRFLMLFCVTARIRSDVLVLKTNKILLILSSAAAKAPPPEYPACSDWSAHACLSLHQLTTTEQLYSIITFQTTCWAWIIKKCATWGCLWCHKVTELKAGLLTRRFRSSVFCGRDELLSVLTLTFLTFKIFSMHKNLKNT